MVLCLVPGIVQLLYAEERRDAVGSGMPCPGGMSGSGSRRINDDLVVPVIIEDPACVAKTFPGFFGALDQLRGAA